MREQAHLTIHDNGPLIMAYCSVGKPGAPTDTLIRTLNKDRATLATRIAEVKNAVPPDMTTVWAGLKDPLAKPDNDVVETRFKQCMEKTVEEGSGLYSDLSGSGLSDILERINLMPEGSQLRIATDCAFLPWEILYPDKFVANRILREQFKMPPADPKKMWGYRFVTEYNLLGTGNTAVQWSELIQAHENGPPFISMNLNSTIEQSFAGRPFLPIRHHEDFCERRLRGAKVGDVYVKSDNIFEQILGDDQQATLLYLYCHGRNTVPFNVGHVELLEFDHNSSLQPKELSAVENTYARAPVVFLNACTSGQPSPLSFNSFHSAFRGKKAMGIIGTAIEMPATFAAAFGCKLIEYYLDGKPLGVAVYALRRELVDKGNPLGLFYSLQCPAEVTAPGSQAASVSTKEP